MEVKQVKCLACNRLVDKGETTCPHCGGTMMSRRGDDRRADEDRRQAEDPAYKGPERREGKDRRQGERRKFSF